MPGLTFEDYKTALVIQDACNLSGVVHSFSRMMNKIWEEAHKTQKSTDWVNKHPIAILFADKIAHLSTGLNIIGSDVINTAYDTCEKRSKE